MDATIENNSSGDLIPIELIESCLELSGWEFQRDDDDNSIQCIAQSRWGDMGAMFSVRHEPPAVHFSVTLDVKPKAARKVRVSELVMMANERLWLGHFDYWIDESVIMFRHTIPLLDRGAPTIGEVRLAELDVADAGGLEDAATRVVVDVHLHHLLVDRRVDDDPRAASGWSEIYPR